MSVQKGRSLVKIFSCKYKNIEKEKNPRLASLANSYMYELILQTLKITHLLFLKLPLDFLIIQITRTILCLLYCFCCLGPLVYVKCPGVFICNNWWTYVTKTCVFVEPESPIGFYIVSTHYTLCVFIKTAISVYYFYKQSHCIKYLSFH